MERETLELADLPSRTPRSEAWVRALLERGDEGWSLRYLKALTGTRPTTWPGRSWTYDRATFVADVMPSSQLVTALTGAAGATIRLGGHDATIPALQAQVQAQHRPSHELHDRERLRHPSFEYTLSAVQPVANDYRPGFLVGTDGPSFVDLEAAYRAFFLGLYDAPRHESVPSELVTVRVADMRAWLGPVHVSPTILTASVQGNDVHGAVLELFSPTERQNIHLAGKEEETVEVALPHGLPTANAWLWLKRDGAWLDYRLLAAPGMTDEQLAAAGVAIQRPGVDELARIEALVYGGEGPTVEFKGTLPDQNARTPNPWKTAAAFANGSGGTIVFGLDRDEATVTGLEAADIQTSRDRLGQLIRSRVIPTPEFDIASYTVEAKQILVLTVQPGASPPYAVIDSDSRDRPRFYIRRGASTYHAQPSDLAEVCRRAAQSPSSVSSRQGMPFRV
ncbi:helix-turn-helix domain-containing protein [Geodermatophilus sp. DSM 45219]|uniref:AlbA family DNA-binding domain-containing protein n=1 Tax=Geodermatophilus sp. DSM 45219 TaxID=1881103 RepID=UPI000882361E|nr:ATP-binding protein [Geodermatophilus sp. DSM 45219]SDN38550.1 Putative DNA-binding domain-containing protein [Geodermatophilus sp. DSM 45219]